jgi:hypothetical protein
VADDRDDALRGRRRAGHLQTEISRGSAPWLQCVGWKLLSCESWASMGLEPMMVAHEGLVAVLKVSFCEYFGSCLAVLGKP